MWNWSSYWVFLLALFAHHVSDISFQRILVFSLVNKKLYFWPIVTYLSLKLVLVLFLRQPSSARGSFLATKWFIYLIIWLICLKFGLIVRVKRQISSMTEGICLMLNGVLFIGCYLDGYKILSHLVWFMNCFFRHHHFNLAVVLSPLVVGKLLLSVKIFCNWIIIVVVVNNIVIERIVDLALLLINSQVS